MTHEELRIAIRHIHEGAGLLLNPKPDEDGDQRYARLITAAVYLLQEIDLEARREYELHESVSEHTIRAQAIRLTDLLLPIVRDEAHFDQQGRRGTFVYTPARFP